MPRPDSCGADSIFLRNHSMLLEPVPYTLKREDNIKH